MFNDFHTSSLASSGDLEHVICTTMPFCHFWEIDRPWGPLLLLLYKRSSLDIQLNIHLKWTSKRIFPSKWIWNIVKVSIIKYFGSISLNVITLKYSMTVAITLIH